MLTALIRSSTILGFLLTYLLSGGLFVAAWFLRSDSFAQNELLFSHWAYGWMQERTGLIPIICILLASVGSIVSRLRMRDVRNILGNSNLTMLAYVSLLSSQPKLLFSRPDILLAALLILGLFMLLLSTYKQEKALSEMFHVGLLLGSASLVVGQSILLLLTVAFSLIILRTGNWREWAVFLLGIAMTGVFVLMFTVWNENPITSFQRVVQTAWVGSFSVDKPSTGHAVLFFLIVLSSGSVLKDITVGTVNERNITMTNVGWALGIALMVAVLGLGWQAGLILAAFPLSSFVANGIERNTKWWLQDLQLILLIAAPLLSNLWLF